MKQHCQTLKNPFSFNSMGKTLGIDFGTESVRALIVDTETGVEWGMGISQYAHGVIEKNLGQQKLPANFALQNGHDYLDSMTKAVAQALLSMNEKDARLSAADVIGVGIDFTASTVMPIKDGQPLSHFHPSAPHAYVKLWKHHAAQPEADFINQNAPTSLLKRYGGLVSCEWSLPKLMEFEKAAPALFDDTDFWMEAGDWIVSLLTQKTGAPVRSSCQAGYKALWSKEEGYPSPHFLKLCSEKIHARFESLLAGPVLPLGAKAGELSAMWAEKLGLRAGTAVAVAAIDAHAGVPGSGVTQAGQALCVLGTSTCHMVLNEQLHYIDGIAGAVPSGIVPGLVGYEAGQPAVGDLFAWFVKIRGGALSAESFEALESAAAQVPAGSNGVLALDWWNGNRSVLMDANVKGTWVGLTLTTTEAEMYRSLLEATAFGTRVIFETLERGGVPVSKIILTGGIAAKSPLLCQIYADVLGKEMTVVQASQPVALGAAIYGAAAALGAQSADAFQSLTKSMTQKVARHTVQAKNHGAYAVPYSRYIALQETMHRFYKAEAQGKGPSD